MTIRFDLDANRLNSECKRLLRNLNKRVQESAPSIMDVVIKNVASPANWSTPEYDLELSGQLMDAVTDISSGIYNSVSYGKKESVFSVSIGDIDNLDKLRSKREDFGSVSPSDKSRDAPYWRYVVFGHSPPRQNFTFLKTGDVPSRGGASKPIGAIVRSSNSKMKGTPPTHMYSNGFMASIPSINQKISEAIAKAIADT